MKRCTLKLPEDFEPLPNHIIRHWLKSLALTQAKLSAVALSAAFFTILHIRSFCSHSSQSVFRCAIFPFLFLLSPSSLSSDVLISSASASRHCSNLLQPLDVSACRL